MIETIKNKKDDRYTAKLEIGCLYELRANWILNYSDCVGAGDTFFVLRQIESHFSDKKEEYFRYEILFENKKCKICMISAFPITHKFEKLT